MSTARSIGLTRHQRRAARRRAGPGRAKWSYLPNADNDFISSNGNWVEVAVVRCEVGVRDSKQQGRSPVLRFDRPDSVAFVAGVGASEFDTR